MKYERSFTILKPSPISFILFTHAHTAIKTSKKLGILQLHQMKIIGFSTDYLVGNIKKWNVVLLLNYISNLFPLFNCGINTSWVVRTAMEQDK